MQKVKVTRYVSGRRPEYAPEESSEESSEEEEGFGEGVRAGEEGETGEGVRVEVREEDWRDDPRLRRLRERRAMAETTRYSQSRLLWNLNGTLRIKDTYFGRAPH